MTSGGEIRLEVPSMLREVRVVSTDTSNAEGLTVGYAGTLGPAYDKQRAVRGYTKYN